MAELLAAFVFGALLILSASGWPPGIRANTSVVAYLVTRMLFFLLVVVVLNYGLSTCGTARSGGTSGWKRAGRTAIGLFVVAIAICLIPVLLFLSFPQY